MTTPSILEEIRRVRHEMSAAVGHDPERIVDYFASFQAQNADRIINLADQGPYGRTFKGLDSAVNEEGEPGGGERLSNGKELASG